MGKTCSQVTNGLDTSGMKVWVMPADEEPQPAEVLLKVKRVQNGQPKKVVINST